MSVPSSIPNLYCWLDANYAPNITINPTTKVVTSWTDRASNLVFTGGYPQYAPYGQYSPGVQFRGGTYLQNTGFTQNLGSVHSVVAVVSRVYGGNIFYKGNAFNTSWPSGSKKWWFGDSSGTNETGAVGLYPSMVGNTQNYTSSNQAMTGDLDVVVFNLTSSTNMDIYMNGVVTSGYSIKNLSTLTDPGNNAIIGGAGPLNASGFFTGTLHELCIWSRALTVAEISSTYAYFYQKWGNSFSSLPKTGPVTISQIRNEIGGTSTGNVSFTQLLTNGTYGSVMNSNPNRISTGQTNFSSFYKTGKRVIQPPANFFYRFKSQNPTDGMDLFSALSLGYPPNVQGNFTQLSANSSSNSTIVSNITGAFSLRSLNGPIRKVVQIKHATNSIVQDFYADIYGNLTTAPGYGQTLTNWLGGAQGNVITWYDQTSANNHVTQTVSANQPTINTSNVTISFSGNNWLSNASPTGMFIPLYQNSYSIVTKHRQFTNGTLWSTGNTVSLANGTFNGLRRFAIINLMNFTGYSGYHGNNPSYNGGTVTTSGTTSSTASISAATNGYYNNSSTSISIILTGYYYAQTTGTYTFSLTSDDGAYLWVNVTSGWNGSNLLINDGGNHGPQTINGTTSLTGGTTNFVRVLFGNDGGGGALSVSVATPGAGLGDLGTAIATGIGYQNYTGTSYLQFGVQLGSYPIVTSVINDRTNLTGYINTASIATTTGVTPNIDPAYPQYIGYDAYASTGNTFTGELHSVVFFKIPLSQNDRILTETTI